MPEAASTASASPLTSPSFRHCGAFAWRFATNMFVGTAVVWVVLREFGGVSPIWAIAARIASVDPQVDVAARMVRSRIVNVLVGAARRRASRPGPCARRV